MRRTESQQSDKNAKSIAALGLGVLIAFGIELVVLLIGSVLVSAGVLRPDTEMQAAAAACLLGCFAGGRFACKDWKSGRLLCGLLCGLFCFLLIFLVAIMSSDHFEMKGQGLVELAACLIGGGLAGMTARHKRKKKRTTGKGSRK